MLLRVIFKVPDEYQQYFVFRNVRRHKENILHVQQIGIDTFVSLAVKDGRDVFGKVIRIEETPFVKMECDEYGFTIAWVELENMDDWEYLSLEDGWFVVEK